MSSAGARVSVLACLFGLALFAGPTSLPVAAQSSGPPQQTGASVSWNAYHDTSPPLRSLGDSRTPGHAHPAKPVPQRGHGSGKAAAAGHAHPATALNIPSTSHN